jgi:hypothetical protein
MKHDAWFDSDENKTLMAICTRKQIKNIGIAGIIWGVINIGIGVFAIRVTAINAGLLALGVLMLGTGIQALRRPSLGVLLTETIVSVLLLLWNIGISIFNLRVVGTFEPRGIILPLIVAIALANQYRKLGHLRGLIESVDPEKIQATKRVCKTMLKRKLKDEPLIVETTDRKCRAQLMEDRAFFIQRDLMRAFVGEREAVRAAIAKPESKKWTAAFHHPLGTLRYSFDKKNTEKLKNWLSTGQTPATA